MAEMRQWCFDHHEEPAMSLTFRRDINTYRADGATFSYVIVNGGGQARVTVYTQDRIHFASDDTTIVTLDREVFSHADDLLRDVKEWAQAFDSSEVDEHNYGGRAIDAVTRSYHALGYTR
jgi:hypothetical protein